MACFNQPSSGSTGSSPGHGARVHDEGISRGVDPFLLSDEARTVARTRLRLASRTQHVPPH